MSVHASPPPDIVSEPHGIKYATSSPLGKGGFAICYKAERLDGDKPTGHLVALKIVKTKMEPQKLAQKFVTELQIHSKLSHPNIVGFHRAFAFMDNTYVVLELCSCGSLADLLKKRKCLTMPEIRRLMIQVCGAVKYLHTRNIVHRDLKTGNLFLDDNMNVKVGDFGLAALLVSGKDMDVQRRTTMCGTPNYLAPEILDKTKGHNEKVDLWAIGIIAYTLAVGRAPFHAASREEIYTKLKAGDYTWPELSSITNDISADLRDLVSTLLVPEEYRPCPDAIVAHPFFRIAFVPTKMSPKQVTRKPTWPVTLPAPDILHRGYSDTWWTVCSETGVGQYASGKCFALPGAKKIRSIVKDMEREVAAGRQPVLPIPADTVYTPYPYSVGCDLLAQGTPGHAAEDKETTIEHRQLREISSNEVHAAPTSRVLCAEQDVKRKRDADLMPPPRRRAELTVRKTRADQRPASVVKDREYVCKAENEQNEVISIPKPSQTSTLLADTETKSAVSSAEGRLAKTRSAEATTARKPRSARQQTKEVVSEVADAAADVNCHVVDGTVPKQLTTRGTRQKTKQTPIEPFEIYSDGEDVKKVKSPVKRSTVTRSPAKSASAVTRNTSPNQTELLVEGTDPESVLQRLSIFRNNVASALEKKYSSTRRRKPDTAAPTLPFVSRWVDYSRKHGVGYVLDDGTIGFIASGASTRGPVVPVAVRDGERWLRRIGKKFENLEKVPFHMYEDGVHGISKTKSSTATSTELREKERVLRVLWVKFGRYMSQSLNDGADDEGTIGLGSSQQGGMQFVRFYQRMGNVGIWGFADGCLQLHFPDHTKLVFSADGLHVSATMISPEGASIIAAEHELPPRLLRDRDTINSPIARLLETAAQGDGLDAEVGDTIRANMFREKLEFLVRVLDQWLEGGGLGCAVARAEQLQWTGLWVKDHAKKVDWVTVGRYGGDSVRA